MRPAFVFGFVVASGSAAAQASPYLPLDHPLLPMVEHLIARGDLEDPSPMIRPFRRADLIRRLGRAGPRSPTPVPQGEPLATAFTDPASGAWYRVEPRAGVQAFTRARRDLLHPAGQGGVRHYVDANLELAVGRLVLVSRPVAENRLKLDPDWGGAATQRRKNQAYRFADAYLAADLGPVRLSYGQTARNWGPAGTVGLGLSSYGYPRSDLGLELRLRDLQIDIVGTELTPMTAATGAEHKRFFMAHRLNVRVTRGLHLGVWETAVLAGPDQSFDPYFRNPLALLAFPVQFGLTDNRNTLLGGDLHWRPRPGFLFEAQAAIDDRWRRADDPETGEVAHPGRWAVTVAGAGALGQKASWRATAALVSSLAFRTIDSTQSLIDRGVGIGPHFTDHALVTFAISTPIASRWLLTSDAALLRQGQGRIDAPFPTGAGLTGTPELFLGTVATTYRVGARLAGATKTFGVQAEAGLHHTANAGHEPGATRTRLEARLLATIGLTLGGPLR